MNKPPNAELTIEAPGLPQPPAAQSTIDRPQGSTVPPTPPVAPGLAPTVQFEPASGADYSARPSDFGSVPRPTIGGYEILGELGRGGMGVVYRAKQKGLDRLVAIKMLLAGEHAGPESMIRFQAEAQAVARLQHPNIVQIYEVGTHNGLPFFSLEFVPGGSLAQKIDGLPQVPEDSARLVETIARAMQVAHQLGIVHRDLKPANILLAFSDHSSTSAMTLDLSRQKLLAEGPLRLAIPKIADFGLAKCLEQNSSQTRTGTIMGSPSYMAPEQARGDVHAIGPLSDVYAMGTILYEFLTGRPPFLAASEIDTVQQVVSAEPVPPSRFQPNVPRDLETICLKCLQKDPRKRYASAEALADDLRRFQHGEPILARPVSDAERLWRWCGRNPWLASASAASILLLVVATTVSMWSAITVTEKNRLIKNEVDNAKREAKNAKEQGQLAKDKHAESQKQGTLAATTIQKLLNKVMTQIGDTPNTLELKRDLLETALEAAEQLTETDQSTSKEATVLSAHQQLGKLFQQLGDGDNAFREFSLVNAEARKRVMIEDGTDASRFNLGLSCLSMADVTRELKRDMQACRAYIEESIALYGDILARPKSGRGALPTFLVRYNLTDAHNRMAVHFVRLGDPAASLEEFRRCHEMVRHIAREIDDPAQLVSLDEKQKERAMVEAARIRIGIPQFDAAAVMGMGSMYFRLSDIEKANAHFQQSLAMREKILADKPGDPNAKWQVARVCGATGDFLLQAGRLLEAEPLCHRSLTIQQEISIADPGRADYRRDVGMAHYRYGQLLLRRRKHDDANTQFDLSRAVREKLAAGEKASEKSRMDWNLALAHCGQHQAVAKYLAAVTADPNVDTELLVLAARAYAACSSAVENDAVLTSDYRDKAFAILAKILAAGFQDVFTLQKEPDFDSLRSDSRFEQIGSNQPRSASSLPKPIPLPLLLARQIDSFRYF